PLAQRHRQRCHGRTDVARLDAGHGTATHRLRGAARTLGRRGAVAPTTRPVRRIPTGTPSARSAGRARAGDGAVVLLAVVRGPVRGQMVLLQPTPRPTL